MRYLFDKLSIQGNWIMDAIDQQRVKTEKTFWDYNKIGGKPWKIIL